MSISTYKKHSQAVVLEGSFVGDIAKSAAPSGGQQHNHQAEPEDKVGNAEPAPDAVVTPRLQANRRGRER